MIFSSCPRTGHDPILTLGACLAYEVLDRVDVFAVCMHPEQKHIFGQTRDGCEGADVDLEFRFINGCCVEAIEREQNYMVVAGASLQLLKCVCAGVAWNVHDLEFCLGQLIAFDEIDNEAGGLVRTAVATRHYNKRYGLVWLPLSRCCYACGEQSGQDEGYAYPELAKMQSQHPILQVLRRFALQRKRTAAGAKLFHPDFDATIVVAAGGGVVAGHGC